MRRPIFLSVAALALLPACVNPYRANFNSTLDRFPTWIDARLAPPAPSPRLIKSDDIRSAGWDLFSKGYVMVGFTKFDAPQLNAALALDEARKLGADIVLVQDVYTKSLTETVAVTQWPADQTTEVHEETQTTGRNGVPRQFQRTTEVTTSGSPETVYVPKQVDYYTHSATFWRKLQRPIFGAFVSDLSESQKTALQTNHGLVVKAIIADSPAFQADLLKGDIIREVDGQPAPSAARFYEDLAQKAGKEVAFTVVRGDQTLEKKVKLNS